MGRLNRFRWFQHPDINLPGYEQYINTYIYIYICMNNIYTYIIYICFGHCHFGIQVNKRPLLELKLVSEAHFASDTELPCLTTRDRNPSCGWERCGVADLTLRSPGVSFNRHSREFPVEFCCQLLAFGVPRLGMLCLNRPRDSGSQQ